jgi:DNA-binding NtrC family response regulator
LSGLDLQQRLAKSSARTSIIFLTGHGDIPTSVRAIKAGALEFLTKPYADADLIAALEQGFANAEREQADARAREERLDARIQSVAGGREGGRPAIGQSAEWKDVLRKATQVASTEAIVLLQGESGTGKEVVARLIHRSSPRKAGPFVAINCAALPDHLLESELFGYERGAFTGAQQPKPGQIELASGGVLFLDEVTEMSAAAQAKLLRVLQEREFQRLGGTRLLKANVRVIAATNRDLEHEVKRGRFREDLYYRLRVFPIHVPPLRERREDIPLLVAYLVEKKRAALGKRVDRIPHRTMEILTAYDWPGNVRELENVIERAVILSRGPALVVDRAFVGAGGDRARATPTTPPAGAGDTTATTLAATEREHILRICEACGWRIKGPGAAAERLGLNPSTLYFRMKKLGIKRPPEPAWNLRQAPNSVRPWVGQKAT